MDKSHIDLIYLCKCAVNKQTPDKGRIAEMDIGGLYRLSVQHTLTAVIAYALEAAGASSTELRQAKEKAIRKNMLLDHERMKLFSFMEKNAVWYMPLKGVILKDIYPALGMRQMADNDILFDSQYRSMVKDYFKSEGYKVKMYGKNVHDVYEKLPVLNFEMHTELFSGGKFPHWIDYYRGVKHRLIKDSGNGHGYHFTDEDLYVYITAHEYKHYSVGGTGIRSLLDRYVFLTAKYETLDRDYIKAECKKLKIAEFEEQSRRLAFAVFGYGEAADLTEEQEKMLGYYFSSGTYGTLDNSVKSNMNEFYKKTGKRSKLHFIFRRIFPDMEFYKNHYPFFYRHKLLLPFGWLFRLIRGVLVNRKKILLEIKTVKRS